MALPISFDECSKQPQVSRFLLHVYSKLIQPPDIKGNYMNIIFYFDLPLWDLETAVVVVDHIVVVMVVASGLIYFYYLFVLWLVSYNGSLKILQHCYQTSKIINLCTWLVPHHPYQYQIYSLTYVSAQWLIVLIVTHVCTCMCLCTYTHMHHITDICDWIWQNPASTHKTL